MLLKREPSNPVSASLMVGVGVMLTYSIQYDVNAIRVDNVFGHQIGHIPRTVASKLAPYIVCTLMGSEGRN